MQFNSVKSGTFLAGAKSVNDNATEIYDTARRTGFQVDRVIKQANASDAVKKVAAARRNSAIVEQASDIIGDAKTEDIKTKGKKAVKDILRPAVRMEGVNRMAGSVAAGAYIMDEAKKQQKDSAALKAQQEKINQAIIDLEKQKVEQAKINAEINKKQLEKLKKEGGILPDAGTTDSSSNSTSSQKVSATGQPEITTLNNSTYTGSLDSLSPEDKKWIAFAVSGEAKLNTDDEFGVSSVILSRMKNRNQSAYDVVHAPGQFAAVVGTPGLHGPTAKHIPGLVDRLFSPEGMAKIEEVTKKLDGRAYFKGQSQLKNRSSKGNKDYNKDGKPDMDPMLHDLGNFYHYGHQG
jgi:hypothetical protein